MLLAFHCASAGKGPVGITPLIKRDQPEGSNPGDQMFLKYWIFTTGEGEAYVNLTSNLRIKEPEDGAIIKMGVFLPLEAGKNTSYDTGLCTLVYKKDGAKQKPPQIEDKWYANMNSWFKVGEQLSCPSRPKAL